MARTLTVCKIMKKSAHFLSSDIHGWPRPDEIERYFLAPPGLRWFEIGSDTAGFEADAISGADLLEPERAPSNVRLALVGHPRFGVLLQWSKWDGQHRRTYYAKGDLRRLHEFVLDGYSDPLSIGLHVPCEVAWKAVKEFLETDGQLPRSIEWIDDRDLPADAFPDYDDPIVEGRLSRN